MGRRTGAVAAILLSITGLADDPSEVNLVYFGAKTDTAFFGAKQGLQEANRLGRLIGQHYVLVTQSAAALEPIEPAPSAIFAAVDAESIHILSELNAGVPVFNLTEAHDGLRALCLSNVLHVIPSGEMKADAVAQWRNKHPDSKAVAQAWHPELNKYGAKQLNQRFENAQGQPMDDFAWAGWAAAKMITNMIARTQHAEPDRLLKDLKTLLAFNGRKGIRMDFRPNGQLSQVMLVVEEGEIAGEAPVKGVVDPADLDSLGQTNCQGRRAAGGD